MATKHKSTTLNGNAETRSVNLSRSTMRNVRPPEARFRELVQSKTYSEEFHELKVKILSIKSDSPEERSTRKWLYFFKLGVHKTGWMLPSPITIEEAQDILKNGNINEHWVMIPEEYSKFKERWEVEYLFDPHQGYKKGFNPIDSRTPVTLVYLAPQDKYKPYKVLLEIDIRHPLIKLASSFKEAIEDHQSTHNLKKRRAERYDDEVVSKVHLLFNQKMGPMEIFKSLYSKFKNFSYSKDYIEKSSHSDEQKEAVRIYKRIQRITKRLMERESKTV